MIIDSHCHLDYSNLYNQLDEVVKRAEKNNVNFEYEASVAAGIPIIRSIKDFVKLLFEDFNNSTLSIS